MLKMFKIKSKGIDLNQAPLFVVQGTVIHKGEWMMIVKTMEGRTLRLLTKSLTDEFKHAFEKDDKVRVNIRSWTRDYNFTALYAWEVYKIKQFVGCLQNQTRHDTAEITGIVDGIVSPINQNDSFPTKIARVTDKYNITHYIRYNPNLIEFTHGGEFTARVEMENTSYWLNYMTDKVEIETAGFKEPGYYFCDKPKTWTDKDGLEHAGKEYTTILRIAPIKND